MKTKTKDDLQIISALIMLLCGVIMSFLGFFCDPLGVIHDSVLWFFAQCLVWAGSIFGISTYINRNIKGVISDILSNKDKSKDNEK